MNRKSEKRVVHIAGLWQETNSFSTHLTSYNDYSRGYLLIGQEMINTLSATNTEIGGFIQALDQIPSIIVQPGFAGWAAPGGPVQQDVYDRLATLLIESLQKGASVDAILLSLHGALVSRESEDCEGDLIEKVRQIVGDSIPIVCSLDFHAAVTEKMLTAADILVGYRTYPHVDYAQTGERAVIALKSLTSSNGCYTTLFGDLPMILPVENTETESGPLCSTIQRLQNLDSCPGVLSASFFSPHPWLDVPEAGVSMLVHADNRYIDQILPVVKDTLLDLWLKKKDFYLDFPDMDTFLQSIDSYQRPIFLVDLGDITSAGGHGDSTIMLRAFLDHPLSLRTTIPLVDPQTVQQAVAIGEGGTGEFSPGGASAEGYNQRIAVHGTVLKISNQPVRITGRSFFGMSVNLGQRALIQIRSNLFLVVSEYGSLMHDPELLRGLGLDPGTMDVIVQKSHKLFRPAYQGFGGTVVQVDTPGLTDRNIKRLPYNRIRRPIYPLDESFDDSSVPRIRLFPHRLKKTNR